MTSKELFEKMKPSNTHVYHAQLNSNGLDFNTSDLFSRLIKDAARCNSYSSDIYYDMCHIDERMKVFKSNDEFEPIWLGFRKMGVDCTSFVLYRCNNESMYSSLSNNYFALYSINIKEEENDFYTIELNEYFV